jgi:3D (Asp-Asp-Asp) domain-containing protein
MNKNWKVKYTGGSAKIVSSDGKGTIATIIVTSNGTPDEKRENARILAAAPELLEALQEQVAIAEHIYKYCTVTDIHGDVVDADIHYIKKAKDAIAKARNG